jgi:hypothetical protein
MPLDKYEKRRDYYSKMCNKRSKQMNIISNTRLASFLIAIIGAVAFYLMKQFIISGAVLIGFMFLFIYLIMLHEKLIMSKNYYVKLEEINGASIKRIKHDWKNFTDKGNEFYEKDHPYSSDLDIFGKGSLFQWINTAQTYLGRQRFSRSLTTEPKNAQEINIKQEAIEELSGKLAWRQRFSAESLMSEGAAQDPEFLFQWAQNTNESFCSKKVTVCIIVLPIITVALIVLYSLGFIPFYAPLAALAFQAIILKVYSTKVQEIFNTASRYKGNIKVFDKMLRLIELRKFDSKLLMQLKTQLANGDKPAYSQVNQFYKIIDAISSRANMAYFIFNIVTLWDFHTLCMLEDWKKNSGKNMRQWLEVIGEFEMLSSLAVIHHDNPDWAIPVIADDKPMLSSKKLGHPLLLQTRVCNDFQVGDSKNILLITGSNMSGKSTLLRTVGVNLVLAYAGAPVCATEFNCSIMDIYSCMRVNDNLEDNISSFYAEILRIKLIIDAVRNGKQVFFLLDEIFKGTNSVDRHTGARVLINMLNKQGATGIVSTHDLELGDMEKESKGRILNYHFREYYANNELSFDYKLRKGISTTKNAVYLMKMAGIEFDEKVEGNK